MKRLSVGIIGYGWVAGAHIAAINATKTAEVTALCSSRPLDSKQLTEKHGSQITPYTGLIDLLSHPGLDVVSICSYPHQHREHAVAAAQAGKYLIIEKPLALSWKDCQAVAAAVEKARVKACVCFECRYSSQFLATKSVIDQGLARGFALRRSGLLPRHRPLVRGNSAGTRAKMPAAAPC